jgi:hypothetical protein
VCVRRVLCCESIVVLQDLQLGTKIILAVRCTRRGEEKGKRERSAS